MQEQERERILNHLSREYTEPIRDPIWKNILFSRPLLRLIDLPQFQKLNGIKQLGPTYLVYPGATHTRLNHSLGVFHLARRMITVLVGKRGLAGCTLAGVKAFLCAALLHDLGHYPYAHSLKDLSVESHESLTAARLLEEDFAAVIREEVGTDPSLVAAIIDSSRASGNGGEVRFFRRLLSGVLDPDKLDYLNRDAAFCGIPYGVQDVDFILDEIGPDSDYGLGISRKGLVAVESILFSKYLMYRSVYWHKTVRIATAMIKKAVLLALAAGVLRPSSFYWLDDREFLDFAGRLDFPPFQLVRQVSERRLYKALFAVPFRPDNPLHLRLEDLPQRLRYEEALALEVSRRLGRPLASSALLIDIPERVSFEVDLPVSENAEAQSVPFASSRSVFTPQTVDGFSSSLRTAALIACRDGELIEALERIGPRRILEEGVA